MQKPLLITTGEPAGIGMDIVLDVLVHHADILKFPIIITADKRAFCQRAKTLYQLKKIPHLPNFQTILVDDALYDLQDKITQPIVLIDTPCLDKVSHCFLICISLLTNDVEHLFQCLILIMPKW